MRIGRTANHPGGEEGGNHHSHSDDPGTCQDDEPAPRPMRAALRVRPQAGGLGGEAAVVQDGDGEQIQAGPT